MFMFIIYVLILFISSIGCGNIIKKDNKLYPLKSIIGFCILLGISQIIYYPMQYFKVSSNITNITTLIILLTSFIYGLTKITKEDFKFLKSYEFWIIFLMVFIIIKIIPGVEVGDDLFYFSLFKDNAYANSINTIDPRVGIVGEIDEVYLYQGFYLLMSFLYRVQNTLFNGNLNNIFVSYRTTMSLFSIILTSIMFLYIKDIFKNKNNKKVFYLIQLLSLLLIAIPEWEHIYWGSFMLIQIYVPLAMILMNDYLKNNNTKYLIMVVNFGMLSLSSTMLFIFAIIAFSYFVYELFKKTAKFKDYYLMLIPLMIYASFILNKIFLLPIIFILFLVAYKLDKPINIIINKYLKYFVFVLPIIFVLVALKMHYKFRIEPHRVSKVTILYTLAIAVYTLYLIIKKEKINPTLYVAMIIALLFFNPIVEPFVSHFLTSTYVYYRLFYLTKNPFIVTILFLSIYEQCKKHKYKTYLKPIYYFGIILLILNYSKNFLSTAVFVKNYDIDYNYILREDKYSRELGEEVMKLEPNSKVFSVYFAPRMYNDKLITRVARHPDPGLYNEWETNITVGALYRESEMSKEEFALFEKRVEEMGYNYLITYNNKEKLNKFNNTKYDIIYENKLFVLIKVGE